MATKVKSDIEIARAAKKRPIVEIGAKLGIPAESLEPYGNDKAKVSADFIKSLARRPDGKLILVTAISPTPAGEGKTTTTVGLGDALNRIGKRAAICLREPSLGPCFGMKGGAAGGGYAQVVPMEDINLHFTGDFHAITAAHNLLSAMIDNHLYWGNALDIDSRRIVWRRVHRHERPGAARDRLPRSAASPTAFRARPASTSPSPRRSWRSSASPTTSTTCSGASATSSSATGATRAR